MEWRVDFKVHVYMYDVYVHIVKIYYICLKHARKYVGGYTQHESLHVTQHTHSRVHKNQEGCREIDSRSISPSVSFHVFVCVLYASTVKSVIVLVTFSGLFTLFGHRD